MTPSNIKELNRAGHLTDAQLADFNRFWGLVDYEGKPKHLILGKVGHGMSVFERRILKEFTEATRG